MNIFTKFNARKKIDNFFSITQKKSTIRREFIGGTTTFFAMAYILVINPQMLSDAGMDKGAVFTGTALSAIVATLIMALIANLPFALAPGMGINAFFTYTVVTQQGHHWQVALVFVFISGIIFVFLAVFNIRSIIVDAIPRVIKQAIPVGIGLFIAFIGLQNAKIVIGDPNTLVKFAGEFDIALIIGAIALVVTVALLILKIPGAIFIGIFVATIFSLFFKENPLPENFSPIQLPPSVSPVFWKFNFGDFVKVPIFESFIIIFSFLFVDMFDSTGTLLGVASKGNLIDKKGKMPRMKQAFLADSCGTVAGSMLGTPTVTTYVESATGVVAGGRTGLTALTVAFWFFLALFFSPIFSLIPAAATSGALIVVGFYMVSEVSKINFNDLSEALPAFFLIIIMPLAFGIDKGIIFGVLLYVILQLGTGKYRQVKLITFVLAILFILRLIFSFTSGI